MNKELSWPMTMIVWLRDQAVWLVAAVYILSGVSQPLLMSVCKTAGLANATAEIYMFFYYLGPSLLIFTLFGQARSAQSQGDQQAGPSSLPPSRSVFKASLIALFDLSAQALNYTGATLAGPTIFAIIYSSVTVWTAVFSRLFLGRSLSSGQWLAVFLVFGGLTWTATDSIKLGPEVSQGTMIMVLGSCMHGGTYVMSEAVMHGDEALSPRQNTAIQGLVACLCLGLWQFFYTWPRYDVLIGQPLALADTNVAVAVAILLAFSLANLIHAYAFFLTVKHYPGGATSAGVFKGLQAVLVFVAAHILFCGRVGGNEMCFSRPKFVSLVTVVTGVVIFGVLTEKQAREHGSLGAKAGYTRIDPTEVEVV